MDIQDSAKGFICAIGIVAMVGGACGDENPEQPGLDAGSSADAGVDAALPIDAAVEFTAIRQVLVTERVVVNGAPRVLQGQLAFGQHDAEFFADDDGIVVNAVLLAGILAVAQEIRVIFDERLRYNRLQEFACNDGSYSRVPDDVTNADFINCLNATDQYSNCSNICIDPDTQVPIGLLDQDENGVVDAARMIDYNPDPDITELAVSLICDEVSVPLDRRFSYPQSTGSQTFPSDATSFRGLGPALVLRPMAATGLRGGATCTIEFRDEVINYNGDRVCAPTDGLPSESCTPGDTSRISFGTEPLKVVNSVPADGATGVALSSSSFILVAFNGNMDASTTDITLTAAGVPVIVDLQISIDDLTVGIIDLGQDFQPSTLYELTIGAGFTDMLGGSVVEKTISWTTAGS